MAKYTVKHTCGHEVEHVIFGRHVSRERRLGWFRISICRACAWDLAVPETATDMASWPALQGTDREVEWGMRVRARALTVETLDALISMHGGNKTLAHGDMADLVRETRARWWIDHRTDAIDKLTDDAGSKERNAK